MAGKRLNQERQADLEPKRMEYAKSQLKALGCEIIQETSNRLDFMFKGAKIQFYPYSGWHTGKTVKDGRGWKKLYNQIK